MSVCLLNPFVGTLGGGSGPGAFAVPLDTYSVYGAAASNSSVAINTDAVKAMPNGVAPFTYAWAITAADAAWSILAPTAATTQFRRTGVAKNASYTVDFTCTVTDANGAVAVSAPCSANVFNYGDFGGFLP